MPCYCPIQLYTRGVAARHALAPVPVGTVELISWQKTSRACHHCVLLMFCVVPDQSTPVLDLRRSCLAGPKPYDVPPPLPTGLKR